MKKVNPKKAKLVIKDPEWMNIIKGVSFVLTDGYSRAKKETGITITKLKEYFSEYSVIVTKLTEKHNGLYYDITEQEWNSAIQGLDKDVAKDNIDKLMYETKLNAIKKLKEAIAKEDDTYKLTQAVKMLTEVTKGKKEDAPQEETEMQKLIRRYKEIDNGN